MFALTSLCRAPDDDLDLIADNNAANSNAISRKNTARLDWLWQYVRGALAGKRGTS